MSLLPYPPRPVRALRAPRGGARVAAMGQGSARRLGRTLALAWLLLALLWAPTLGRMHQAGHAPGLSAHAGTHVHEPAAAHVDARSQADSHAHGGWLDHLWAHPAQGAAVDCLLLDQLTLGDVLHAAPLALPTAVPAPQPSPHRAHGPAGQRLAQFQARGPPGCVAPATAAAVA
ncbi:hypothetical protein [Acidovorax sp.]|uniref:hypothetical protein n=1 Tax=Acidovorax sp. TaxID=1872122 RepID=UPI0039193CD4